MTSDLPTPTPEGDLIRLARLRTTPRLSIKAAAEKAGISAETWGYVERGYQSQGQGKPVRVHHPPADTLAHMANVVGVEAERLEGIGRADAAKILREIRRSESRTEDPRRGDEGSPPLSVVPDFPLGLPGDPDPRDAEIETRDGVWRLEGLRDQFETHLWTTTGLPWQYRAAAIRGIREAEAIRVARRGRPVPPEPRVENGTEG